MGSRMKSYYFQAIKEQLDKKGGPRHFFLENLNYLLCLIFPQLQRRVTNHGYAVINQDGKLISDIKVEYEDERFPLQLYHYLATSFEKYKHLGKWSILELECQRGGGIDYIARSLKARKCIGVTSSASKAKFCQRNYCESPKLEFYEDLMSQVLENDDLKDQKFDLILNVEGRSRFGFNAFQDIVKIAEKLLKPGGLFICADFGSMPDMAKMAQTLETSSLKMMKKEDLSVNIQHAIKLAKKKKETLASFSVSGWIRSVLWKLRARERNKLEVSLQNGEGIYMAFLLKMDKTDQSN